MRHTKTILINTATAIISYLLIGSPGALADSASQLGFNCFGTSDSEQTAPFSERLERYSPEVIQRYPHRKAAFTQGLVYKNNNIYESTGLYGESTLSQLNLNTGKIISSTSLAERFFGEGLTSWKDGFILLTWKSGFAFHYNAKLQKTGFFQYEGEGWGITHNGKHLFTSNGSSQLFVRNPKNFKVEKVIDVTLKNSPLDKINELEYVNGCILANIWAQPTIVIISPNTGEVKGFIDLQALVKYEHTTLKRRLGHNPEVLNGIAYHDKNDTLLVTGKRWGHIYEIKLHGH